MTSQLLQQRGVDAPAAQVFFNYLLLGAVFGSQLAYSQSRESLIDLLRKRGLKYFLLSIVDVEANYFIVKAYQYTTMTSVQVCEKTSRARAE